MEFLKDFNEIIRKGAGVEPMPGDIATVDEENTRREAAERVEHAERELELAKAHLDDVEGTGDMELIRVASHEYAAAKNHLKTEKRKKDIADRAHDPFYLSRGVDLISVEVLQFNCSNPETDLTLQEIIKETADRLKKQEFQRGENEVAMSKMGGDIELEKKNKELIEIKKSHMIIESKIEGQAEAQKVRAYMEELTGNDHVTLDANKAVEMFTMIRKMDSIKMLSEGKSTMYITPDDVNLSIGHLYPSQDPAMHGGRHR